MLANVKKSDKREVRQGRNFLNFLVIEQVLPVLTFGPKNRDNSSVFYPEKRAFLIS